MIFLRDVLSGETNKDLRGTGSQLRRPHVPLKLPLLATPPAGGVFSFVGGWIIKLYAVEIYKLLILICIPRNQSRQAKPIDLYFSHISLSEGGLRPTTVIDRPSVAMYSNATDRR